MLNLDPLYLPMTFAATNGGHFLPYMWLHRTRAYAVLAVVCALGPFAILLVAGAQTAFHATGFLVGERHARGRRVPVDASRSRHHALTESSRGT